MNEDEAEAVAGDIGYIVGIIGLPVAGVVCYKLLGTPTNCGTIFGWLIIAPMVQAAWVIVITFFTSIFVAASISGE